MLNFVVIIIIYGGEKDHNNRFIPFWAALSTQLQLIFFSS